MSKIISEEKSFKKFLKKFKYLHGVFGANQYEFGKRFFIFDENLKIIFESRPYNKSGNYTDEVKSKLEELNIKGKNDTTENRIMKIRTDFSVEEMIYNLHTTHFIKWCPWESIESKKDYDIEESSPEWKKFKEILTYYSHKKDILKSKCGFRDIFPTIDYNNYTQKGKDNIDEASVWFENNTSKTPLQDAWFKVLEKDGINVDWEASTFATDDELVMKEISIDPEFDL